MLEKHFPNLKLKNQYDENFDINTINSQFILLYFYPKDMTPGCTTQAVAIRDAWQDILDLNCNVIGVSKDSPKRHLSFVEKYDLPFTLLSDPEGILCDEFGVWVEKSMFGKKYMGIERSSFLLDAERRVIQQWKKVKPANHISDVIEFLSS
ncbi:MAG: thioredoxin-dependent thiol peroxidase [Pseudomonadota bacterium]|nr:thioredoxin-dependent thiol peroxidase [Pseudomonadota bacterium]